MRDVLTPLHEAERQADALHAALLPVVERIEIAGSIRRRRPQVKDIELVIQPRIVESGLFGEPVPDVDAIRDVLARHGTIQKGGDRYIQAVLPSGLKVDAFIVHPPANFWCILAIRTGPADLGHWCMVQMQRRGLMHRDGRIVRTDGSEHPVESEQDFFGAAGLPYLNPEDRDEWRRLT